MPVSCARSSPRSSAGRSGCTRRRTGCTPSSPPRRPTTRGCSRSTPSCGRWWPSARSSRTAGSSSLPRWSRPTRRSAGATSQTSGGPDDHDPVHRRHDDVAAGQGGRGEARRRADVRARDGAPRARVEPLAKNTDGVLNRGTICSLTLDLVFSHIMAAERNWSSVAKISRTSTQVLGMPALCK